VPVPEFPSWPVALLTLPIVARALVYYVAVIAAPWHLNPARPIPAWLQIGQALFFGILGVFLVRFGRSDRRAWALGLFVLDAGTTLLNPVVRSVPEPSWVLWLAMHLRVDAFQAAVIWFFASVFPRSSISPRVGRWFVAGTVAAFALGVLLVIADAIAVAKLTLPLGLTSLASVLQRNATGSADWFFSLQFATVAPLLLLVPVKLREAGPDDRRRFWWLVMGMGIGYSTLIASTAMLSLAPWFGIDARQLPIYRPIIVASIATMSLVPIAATYAALVQRTLDVSIVVRRALQYLLARSVVRVVAAVPFVFMALLVAFNRQSSINDLLSGTSGVVCGALIVAALAAAVGRGPLLAAIDRQFFRTQLDAQETLLQVAEATRRVATVEALRDTLSDAIERAIQPETYVTAIVGTDDKLHAIDADLPALPRHSALSQFLGGGDSALDVARSQSLIERLPLSDQDWLRRSCASVLLPMRGAGAQLLGAIVIGEKRSDQPYTTEDCRLLSAVASAGSLALERILGAADSRERGGTAAFADPPGRECIECGAVRDADAIVCACGGPLQRASAPAILGDRLRFDQRVGNGAMGIVYRAYDLRLAQTRAVKTLPSSDPATIARMQHEARLMAAVQHPGLATVYSLETWRGVPLLVMEFLDGGTLADRLARGTFSVAETATLGLQVGAALAAVHDAGMLHRDVKPSNIGFLSTGQPKLLDFGLAKTATVDAPTTVVPRDGDGSTWSSSFSGGLAGVRGTPPYMSPELLSGSEPSAADDLWALSVTLLESCSGSNPFRGATVAATVARILTDRSRVDDSLSRLPEPARQLFRVLLGPVDRRPATAAEYLKTLASIQ
jgi:hypothetical protein